MNKERMLFILLERNPSFIDHLSGVLLSKIFNFAKNPGVSLLSCFPLLFILAGVLIASKADEQAVRQIKLKYTNLWLDSTFNNP